MSQATPKITAIAPWFGSKRTLAPLIIRQLGDHTQYFEPFCGSMAVLLAKAPSRQETANDLHGDLTNLARVIASETMAPVLYQRLFRVLLSDGLLADAAEILRPDYEVPLPSLDRAFWYFVQSWMMRNGVAGTNIGQPRAVGTQLAVRWTANGGSPTVRFSNAVDSIPGWHERLRNVVILRRDALEILPKVEDSPKTAIYVDPPYVAQSRSGFAGSGAQSRYLHEFRHSAGDGLFNRDDHEALRDVLRVFKKARIVVSYYDCQRVRQLYDGWTFIDCGRQKNLARQNGKCTTDDEAPEVLIVNGEVF